MSLFKKMGFVRVAASVLVLSSASSWAMNRDLPSPPPCDESLAPSQVFYSPNSPQASSPVYPAGRHSPSAAPSAPLAQDPQIPSRAATPSADPVVFKTVVQALDQLSHAEIRFYKDFPLKSFDENFFSESSRVKTFIEAAHALAHRDFLRIQDLTLGQFKKGCDFEKTTFDHTLISLKKQYSAYAKENIKHEVSYENLQTNLTKVMAQVAEMEATIARLKDQKQNEITHIAQALETLKEEQAQIKAQLQTHSIALNKKDPPPLDEDEFYDNISSETPNLDSPSLNAPAEKVLKETELSQQATLHFKLLAPALQTVIQEVSQSGSECLDLSYFCHYLTDEMFDLLAYVLEDRPSIIHLKLGRANITEIAYPLGLKHLTSLDLSGCGNLSDLKGLETLTDITTLNLSSCFNLSDLKGLEMLTNLTTLNLSNCGNLSDLTSLEMLINLTSLDLSWCTNLSDLTSLEMLTNLTTLDLRHCFKFTKDQKMALVKMIPRCKILFYS